MLREKKTSLNRGRGLQLQLPSINNSELIPKKLQKYIHPRSKGQMHSTCTTKDSNNPEDCIFLAKQCKSIKTLQGNEERDKETVLQMNRQNASR